MKCVTLNCENHTHEGKLVGFLCAPCHLFITTGEGKFSQVYRNSIAAQVANRMEDTPTPPLFPREGSMRYNINTLTAEVYLKGNWASIDPESVGIKATVPQEKP